MMNDFLRNGHQNQSTQNIVAILSQLMDEDSLSLNNAHLVKQELNLSAMRPALFEVLCEIKNRIGPHSTNTQDDDHPDPQILRLDNMLLAEGIAGPNAIGEVASSAAVSASSEPETATLHEHSEYRRKLMVIRTRYQEDLDKFEKDSAEFIGHIVTLLQDQALMRPITRPEIDKVVQIIKKKMSLVQQKIKQDTCEMVMLLRSRFLDARRKRRNFSKTATKVLNDYFAANINNPYPTEEVKEDLARRCGISVAQVSNWFGNKRIRFKKNMGRGDSRHTVKEEM